MVFAKKTLLGRPPRGMCGRRCGSANSGSLQVGTSGAATGLTSPGGSGAIGRSGKITRIAIAQNSWTPRGRKISTSPGCPGELGNYSTSAPIPPAFSAKRFKRWYLYRDYTNGLPGLWLSHYLNAVAWYMQDLFPAEVVSSASVLLWNRDDPDDDRETADTLSAILDYPSGFQLNIAMSLCNSADTISSCTETNGKLMCKNAFFLAMAVAVPTRSKKQKPSNPQKMFSSHMHNWLECISQPGRAAMRRGLWALTRRGGSWWTNRTGRENAEIQRPDIVNPSRLRIGLVYPILPIRILDSFKAILRVYLSEYFGSLARILQYQNFKYLLARFYQGDSASVSLRILWEPCKNLQYPEFQISLARFYQGISASLSLKNTFGALIEFANT
jgi:hypothetical protein